MPGRPRKDGERTASGRLSRAKPKSMFSEWQATTAHAQRIRETIMAEAPKHMAAFSTALGHLYMFGQLADAGAPDAKVVNGQRYAAGDLFRGLCEASGQAIGIPTHQLRGQNLAAAGGGSTGFVEDDLARERRERADKKRFAAELAVGPGSRELTVVREVCVYGARPVGHENLLALRRGLQRLVLHFRVAK